MEQEVDPALAIVGAAILFAAIVVVGVYTVRSQYQRADDLLERWAKDHGYQVAEKRRANPIGTGPMQRSGNKQVFYDVVLVDVTGQRKSATVRLGSETIGTLSTDMRVEWKPGSD
jgi:hypothetical protein